MSNVKLYTLSNSHMLISQKHIPYIYHPLWYILNFWTSFTLAPPSHWPAAGEFPLSLRPPQYYHHDHLVAIYQLGPTTYAGAATLAA